MPINHDIKQTSFSPFSTGHSQIGKYYFQENPIILEEMPNFTSPKYQKPSKTPCLIFGKIPSMSTGHYRILSSKASPKYAESEICPRKTNNRIPNPCFP
jgi:hypothetical protein